LIGLDVEKIGVLNVAKCYVNLGVVTIYVQIITDFMMISVVKHMHKKMNSNIMNNIVNV
jgi:hypothetical protein